MYILKKSPRTLALNEPIKHESAHKRPVSRRDFIAQGFRTGPAVVAGGALLSALMGRPARALSPDLDGQKAACEITDGAGKIPFICFDLAGGANLIGSEALIGRDGSPTNFLSAQGYQTLGLPAGMVPGAANPAGGNFVNTDFGIAWHSDGAILRGMLASTQAATRANTAGYALAARSENDTGNNPHNPMYGINKVGADGQLLTLIGSQNSDSGGNSAAPAAMMDPSKRPTKVDRASDVTGLVDTGELGTLFANPSDAVAVLEAMTRLGQAKANAVRPALDTSAADDEVKRLVRCGYLKSTYLAERFNSPDALDPNKDLKIVGAADSIFTQAEYNADGEFRKTAAVMKMVIEGLAGAGTITMGGFDYHNQGRNTGETRNFRAGRCIGACLDFARRVNKPVMIYIFSDGALSASAAVNNTPDGRGKLEWVSDNQSTAGSIVLVYNPTRRAVFASPTRLQIGSYSAAGSVVTSSSPVGNAVNLLVETVIYNYMALHGQQGQFANAQFFPRHGLGAALDGLRMFEPICNNIITQPT